MHFIIDMHSLTLSPLLLLSQMRGMLPPPPSDTSPPSLLLPPSSNPTGILVCVWSVEISSTCWTRRRYWQPQSHIIKHFLSNMFLSTVCVLGGHVTASLHKGLYFRLSTAQNIFSLSIFFSWFASAVWECCNYFGVC